ncbi:NADPH-dependent oxidoreductase [Staphylococcus chromogenes]|nr:NADPH-dependent oxidoreductase [Staphylococcus chromogenes]
MTTIETQLAHRTIREFTDEPVPQETLTRLLDVAMHAPTSLGMQTASIIHITDQKLKDELAVIGNQEYVRRAPVYLLYLVDAHRAAEILKEQGAPTEPASYAKNFVQGFTDAILMAQNVCVAAESLGLGVNYLGNIHNDARAVINLLGLPQLTYPAVGMTLGWPNQDPQLKPRMPRHLRVFENGYHAPASWSDALADYDAEMQTYYDLRNANQRVDSFTKQVLGKFTLGKDNRDLTFEIAREQGFDV